MPPLSCAPGCDSCVHLSEKIVELEARIATLHQIEKDEQFLDTILSPEPWRRSKHHKHGRRSGRHSGPAQPIRLENRYAILTEDEEPLQPRDNHPGPSSVGPPTPSSRTSSASTLVIGSSMVRDLCIPPSCSGPSKVYCFPGAKVLDIQQKLPSILARHTKVNNIIITVGASDIRDKQSVALQENYKTLITTLMGTEKALSSLGLSYLQKRC
ncbi:hypothetical protein AALO_G00290680 [Alosa alosa]|uniref:Uncharacterized protein n=1 Tax=Alosa alosa TaxID=278164 RepID=A0AAV6FGP3_9TELE|nr:hypothetical protein AALO_G00290680 [Alosa alosa]